MIKIFIFSFFLQCLFPQVKFFSFCLLMSLSFILEFWVGLFFFLPPSFQHFELLFHYVLTPVVSDEKFCSHLSSWSPVYNVFFYSTKIFFLIFSLWQLDYNVWISSCAEFTDLLKSISRSFTKFRKLLVSIYLISFFFLLLPYFYVSLWDSNYLYIWPLSS